MHAEKMYFYPPPRPLYPILVLLPTSWNKSGFDMDVKGLFCHICNRNIMQGTPIQTR